jgi:hypothetical protein
MYSSDDNEAVKNWNVIYASMDPEEKRSWDKDRLEEKREQEIDKKLKDYQAKLDIDKNKKIEEFEKRIRTTRQQSFLNKDTDIKTVVVTPVKIEQSKPIVPDALYAIKSEPIIPIQSQKNKSMFKEEGIAHPDVLAINKALYGKDF